MKKSIIRQLEVIDRSKQFVLDHPFTPAIPRAAVLITKLTDSAESLRTWGSSQVTGFSSFRAAAQERATRAEGLRLRMADLSDTARKLDSEQYPGAGQMYRLPRSKGYQALINSARSFLEVVAPYKAAFIEHGQLANFDETLQTEIADLEAITQRKYQGRQRQKNGTSDLENMARAGMIAVRQLGTIVRNKYRADEPALYDVWKAAARVGRGSRPSVADAPTQAPGGAGAPPAAPAAS